MEGHKKLIAWQKGIDLVKKIYKTTASFPDDERFGLVNQMRRCSVSIPSNIAEGFGRRYDKELIHFLYIALGSSHELDTQMIISKELQFMNEQDYYTLSSLNSEVGKMLSSLIHRRIQKLDTNDNNPLV